MAIFLATGGAGRAVAGKCPKRGLKCYLGGPAAVKNALQNALGAKAAKTDKNPFLWPKGATVLVSTSYYCGATGTAVAWLDNII